jgi:polyphosphate glucokinase
VRTLAIDIGGTGLKMLVLDEAGDALTDRGRIETPRPATPAAVLDALVALSAEQGVFDRVSCGFPGVVTEGVVYNAPNLDDGWPGFALAEALATRLGKPTRVANDADVQGYGAVQGKGVELVITLGTGLGSALFVDGVLIPNLELGHHPFRDGKTYEQELGSLGLKAGSKKAWRKRVHEAIGCLERLFNYRTLFIGGGNAKKLKDDLPDNVTVVDNRAGLLGGIALWR